MRIKQLPPYGAPLAALIKQGLRPHNSVYIFTGLSAWAKGKNSSIMRPTRTLVLPAYIDPQTYEWPVTECSILIFDTGYCEQQYIEDLVICLFYAGVTQNIQHVSPEFETTYYQKDL